MLRDGEPCSHKGCLNHISHPCEGCGRIGGKIVSIEQIEDMTIMTYNCLKRNGINELKQIKKLSEEDMNNLQFMSYWKKKIINEIRDIKQSI